MALIRLQKYLAAAGVCSRREGERLILNGDVRVNGKIIRTLGTKVDSQSDRVEFQGVPVTSAQRLVYIALNKPTGYVTSCRQPQERIVLDLIRISERLYPVGRLDKDSEGLLLLTNDGRLHHRLSHPSFDHEKVYQVTVANKITDRALHRLAGGVILDGRRTRPAKVTRIAGNKFQIILREGRNRQIRRMAGKVGARITRLKRIRIANIRLAGIKPGSWRYITEKERALLLKSVK